MSAIKKMCGELYPSLLENMGHYDQWQQNALVIDEKYLAFNVFSFTKGPEIYSKRSKIPGMTELVRSANDNLIVSYIPSYPMQGIMISEKVFDTDHFTKLSMTDNPEEPFELLNSKSQKVEHCMNVSLQSAVVLALATVVCDRLISRNVQHNREHILASAV